MNIAFAQLRRVLQMPLAVAGLLTLAMLPSLAAAEAADSLVLKPADGQGEAKSVVLIAGDEEYRSEESLPMLAKLLSQKHGFHCTVLFSFGPGGADYIDPNNQQGLRGLEALDDADLMIIATRFRRPSAEQAKHVTQYLNAGKPVIGLRTATHAFTGGGTFGESIPYGQFGRKVLGEQWVSHHGAHKREGTRSVVQDEHRDHPILNGVDEIFAPTDVYGVVHLTDEDQVLLRGAVTESLDPASPNVQGDKNDPMQPLAWLHSYTAPDGAAMGQSFCTTAGGSVDFVDEDLRRLVVNAAYYLTGQDVPAKADVAFVDPFYPSFYGFIRDKDYWQRHDMQPADYGLGKSPVLPDPPGSPEWPHRPQPGLSID
ncbi:ThuA domain-containing protein [Roseimaritima sediminicola]|uniref:ThuA domain-containing protein n=1 Tax=Roseimaritima sediminicola TaxID=2662066 RepID=UPI001F2EE8C1|nr:ThuA domain-containing protein [Roseimaritima sediminicola]